jgi:NADPH:quinone reductase-like Zn-dependent oxidoreductase
MSFSGLLQAPLHILIPTAALTILLAAVIIKLIFARKKPTAIEIVRSHGEGSYLKGKTYIVTGGNSGIGLETCKALASAGARVILCSRSIHAGEQAIKDEVQVVKLIINSITEMLINRWYIFISGLRTWKVRC